MLIVRGKVRRYLNVVINFCTNDVILSASEESLGALSNHCQPGDSSLPPVTQNDMAMEVSM